MKRLQYGLYGCLIALIMGAVISCGKDSPDTPDKPNEEETEVNDKNIAPMQTLYNMIDDDVDRMVSVLYNDSFKVTYRNEDISVEYAYVNLTKKEDSTVSYHYTISYDRDSRKINLVEFEYDNINMALTDAIEMNDTLMIEDSIVQSKRNLLSYIGTLRYKYEGHIDSINYDYTAWARDTVKSINDLLQCRRWMDSVNTATIDSVSMRSQARYRTFSTRYAAYYIKPTYYFIKSAGVQLPTN